jgi:hypothetical protein
MSTSNIKLELFRQIDKLPKSRLIEFKELVQRFLKKYNSQINLTETDITVSEIQTLIANSQAFDFLNNEAEDIYSDSDLKLTY